MDLLCDFRVADVADGLDEGFAECRTGTIIVALTQGNRR